MRTLSAWVVLVVLLGGLLVPCPACERAESASIPVDAHACCERTQSSNDVSQEDPSGQPDSQDECSRISVTRILAALETEQPVSTLLTADHTLPDTIASLPLSVPSDTSPDSPPLGVPPSPYDLGGSPQDLGSLILPLRL